jgi:regulator of replication initiation timing
MQGPLIISLTHKVTSLEMELVVLKRSAGDNSSNIDNERTELSKLRSENQLLKEELESQQRATNLHGIETDKPVIASAEKCLNTCSPRKPGKVRVSLEPTFTTYVIDFISYR